MYVILEILGLTNNTSGLDITLCANKHVGNICNRGCCYYCCCYCQDHKMRTLTRQSDEHGYFDKLELD